MRFLLLVVLLASPASAHEASVDVDLSAGRMTITAAEESHVVELTTDLRAEFASWRRGLANGDDVADQAAALSQALLGEAYPHLRDATQWRVWPLEIAPLSALPIPGSAEPILSRHQLWYSADANHTPPPAPRGDLLLVAPYTPGVDTLDDDPYDLLPVVRKQVRRVALIPRNDTTPARVATALGEEKPGMIWLRATPEVATNYIGRLNTSLVWWTRSDDELSFDVEAALSVVASSPAPTLSVDLWPVVEMERRPGVRTFTSALVDGDDVLSAHTAARRELATASPASEWAGWILVGNPQTRVQVPGPGWLQRLFGR